MYDLIIVGAGAAGLSSAIYAGRAKLRTLVIEKAEEGGQIKITAEVMNYPGVFSTSGAALAGEMKRQAVNFGVEFVKADVASVDFSQNVKTITTKSGETYAAVGVIIATGAKPRKLGFEGEIEFAGRGIAYCATCDGEFFTGKDVFVIGAGFAAAEEAIFLTRFAKHVTVIAREPEFTCSKTIADKVLAHPNITVKFNSEIQYVRGENVIKEAKFINNTTQETWEHKVNEGTFGVFIFVGYEPESGVFKGHVDMDKWGYILTDEDMQTNVQGVHAAGDIRPKRLRQLVTATADGAIASTAIEKYIDDTKEKAGIVVEVKTATPSPSEEEKVNTVGLQSSGDQIKYVMERCTGEVSIHAVLQADCVLSGKIKAFLNEFASITDRVPISFYEKGENTALESQINASMYPVIALMGKDGVYSGVSFHAEPAGHELESFILAIYNVAGPGQRISEALLESIKKLPPVNIKIAATLSCTMCPEVVQGSQRIASLNEHITSAMVDLQYFPEFQEKHSAMSVPALIINDEKVIFGKKSLEELVEILA
ncbi:MAG: FAD-dependent oxidoreductase [Defluviitaleaceae bacterium]|nr:FAD-dependent oxidoreductase [Defluviitaleaceae bacterium]